MKVPQLLTLIGLVFVWVGPACALPLRILPTVDGVVRDGLDFPKDGIPDSVIGNTVVQILNVNRPIEPFEDRGVVEFDISSVSRPLPRAELRLPVFGSMGPYPFAVSVFTYAGDGSLTLSDFNAGSLTTSFQYAGEALLTLDVTSLLNSLGASTAFLGFNFRTSPSDIPLNGPFLAFGSLDFPPTLSLDVVPEPSSLVLLGSGLIGLGGALWRCSRHK